MYIWCQLLLLMALRLQGRLYKASYLLNNFAVILCVTAWRCKLTTWWLYSSQPYLLCYYFFRLCHYFHGRSQLYIDGVHRADAQAVIGARGLWLSTEYTEQTHRQWLAQEVYDYRRSTQSRRTGMQWLAQEVYYYRRSTQSKQNYVSHDFTKYL